jgi:predicted membrane protein
MRYKISSALWGLFWIVLGLSIAGNAFDWWDVSLFFSGWWTLFIIIPCGISVLSGGFGNSALIGLTVGVLLLLKCQGVIESDDLRRLLVPIILVLIGINLIVRNLLSGSRNVKVSYTKEACRAAIFGANRIVYPNIKYFGGELDAIFGGVTLDLRGAIIDENIIINATSIFGGIDICAPDNVRVKVISTSFFGGVGNKVKRQTKEECPIIYLNATCMFGGVDIK